MKKSKPQETIITYQFSAFPKFEPRYPHRIRLFSTFGFAKLSDAKKERTKIIRADKKYRKTVQKIVIYKVTKEAID